jgi:hypothetical protein
MQLLNQLSIKTKLIVMLHLTDQHLRYARQHLYML